MKMLNVDKDRGLTDVSINFIIAAYFSSITIILFMQLNLVTLVVLAFVLGVLRAMDVNEPRIVLLNARYKLVAEVLTPNYPDGKYVYDINEIPDLAKFVSPPNNR